MKISLIHILTLLIAFFALQTSASGAVKTAEGPFLEVILDKNNTVEGERLIYEVKLFSPDPNIAGAELEMNPDFKGLSVHRFAPDSFVSQEEKDGVTYYTAVIDRFFIGTNHKGKYNVRGGTYKIGYNRQVQVNDPFWGPSMATRIETMDVKAPSVKINVSALPEKGRPDNFSGAVGQFRIETELHSAAVAGEEICLLVTISGLGDLTDAKLPDISNAFGEGLRFRSMTETREHYISQGSLGSELQMECAFTADKPGAYTINPICFTYFDTVKGEYAETCSEPLRIIVENGGTPDEGPPELHDI